jgi:hypothetical protein
MSARSRLLGATALALVVAVAGCQPRDERPGLWVRGDVVREPVADWGFTDDVEEVFIETRPWYRIPHSTTIWCVALDGALYVGTDVEEERAWSTNLERNGEARIAISGRVYEVRATRVRDAARTGSLDAAYGRKYDMAEVYGEEIPEWFYYRLDQRGVTDSGA